MTEPLTPPECDLRGLPCMFLDVVRLMDSDLFALSTGDEFKAAVALWCKSWLQVPAGSLPNDPRILAHLSATGARWPRVAAMALRGWQECSDGRLYHPVVAEKAMEAWQSRLAQRARTQAATAARMAKRGASDEAPGSGTPPNVTTNVTLNATEDVTSHATHNVTFTKGEGREREEKERTPSQPSAVRSPTGTRLPPDWQPDAEMAGFANKLGLDADAVAPQFRDYWHAKPGKDGRKLDWAATWRTWCRTDASRAQSHGKPKPSNADWMFRELPDALQ